jgi:uncharacterized surface protein with fasciclin (FAS1) repeats
MSRPRLVSAACLLAVTLLAGTSAQPARAQEDASEDVVRTLASRGRYKTLINLLVATDLTDTLRSAKQLTLFAPTDEAFDRLPDGALDELLKPDNRETLRQILGYHVVPKVIDFQDLSSNATPRTLSGEPLTLAANAHGRAVNDATIVASQKVANGVVYRIDRVLMPLPDPLKVAASAGLGTLASLVEKAGLAETLRGAGPFTIFAPTDEAFARLGSETLERLARDPEALKAVLLLHVIPARASIRDLHNTASVDTLAKVALPIVKDDHGLRLGQRSRILKADVRTRSGFVHVIDQVLDVPSPRKTVVDVAAAAGKFQTLLAAAKAAGLAETLAGKGPFTVFAPTDEAFARLGNDTLQSLLEPRNRKQLETILKYHVVPGRRDARDLVAEQKVETVQGGEVKTVIREGRILVNDAQVIDSDIAADNGLIHVIDRVLTPPRD